VHRNQLSFRRLRLHREIDCAVSEQVPHRAHFSAFENRTELFGANQCFAELGSVFPTG
jgi:hypothetical protein